MICGFYYEDFNSHQMVFSLWLNFESMIKQVECLIKVQSSASQHSRRAECYWSCFLWV